MGPVAAAVFSASDFFLKASTIQPVSEAFVNTFRPKGIIGEAGVITNTKPIQEAVMNDGSVIKKTPSSSEYYTLRKTDAKQFGGNSNTINWKMTPGEDGQAAVSVVQKLDPKKYPPGSYAKTEFGLKKVEQGDFGPEVKLYSTDIKTGGVPAIPDAAVKTPIAPGEKPIFVLPKERMGLSERPVTTEQINTLSQIGKTKGLAPDLQDAIVKTLTGKESIADLTEKEFVRVSQSLSNFGEKYVPKTAIFGPGGYTRSVLQPQRHYFDYVEDTFGYPLKSQVYTPMERAAQLSKNLTNTLQPELDDVFGKYTASKYIEERRLVDAYSRGETSAITNNPLLNPETKTELIDVANKLKAFYEKNGEVLNVGKDAYLKNYGGPKIADISGTMPQYKSLDSTPSKEFFAKFKREGNLTPFIDDPYAAGQVYINQGSKALHFGPVLKNFEELHKSLPKNFADQANSYVQEKLGRLGSMEKFVDSFVPAINKKFGINLPMDTSRQVINYGLSSMYSGLVGTPAAIFKQTFQLPTFVYAKLGTEFAGEAIAKSMIPAERARIAKLGFLNDVSVPYGSELAKDFNPVGKAANVFKNTTQAIMKPITAVDNDIRIKTFLQAEMQWNDAINKFNAGKMQWPQLESKLDFKSLSAADRNIIRQGLIKGESGTNGSAFTTYMRETLDETSFPFRTGAGARVGYGLSGKLATGLLNYTIESTAVLARWAKNGDWDKILRFAGNAKAVNDTLQETFGFDFSDTLYQKPNGVESPAVGLATNFYKLGESYLNNNREDINKNQAEIVRTLTSAVPAGVFGKNLARFMKSYNIGADKNGKFPIYDDYGKMITQGDFSDLFWGTLMGFPTVNKVNERNLYNDIKNRITEDTAKQAQVDELLRSGNYDKMEEFINKTGATPSQNAMESYYIPRTQRLFNSVKAKSKPDFIDRVFNN